MSPSSSNPPPSSYHYLPYYQNLKKLHEKDEVCRLQNGKLVFGVVSSRKIYWNIGNHIEIEVITKDFDYSTIRLIDRPCIKPQTIVEIQNPSLSSLSTLSCATDPVIVTSTSKVAIVKNVENSEIIIDVPIEKLEPILRYRVGQKIIMNNWLGEIESIVTEATLILPGGSILKIPDENLYPGLVTEMEIENKKTKVFVAFLKVASVKVNWIRNILRGSRPSTPMPKPLYSKSELKKSAVIVEDQTVFGYYRYSMENDLVVKDLEDYFKQLLFTEGKEEKIFKNSVAPMSQNLRPVVRVLRMSSILHTERGPIRSCSVCIITKPHPLSEGIVQTKLWLSGSNSETFGVIIKTNNDEDTLEINWIAPDDTVTKNKIPIFDIEAHSIYDHIKPGLIVSRGPLCKLSEQLFSFGIVRKITSGGFVIVFNPLSKKEFFVRPFELSDEFIKINYAPVLNYEQQNEKQNCKKIKFLPTAPADHYFYKSVGVSNSIRPRSSSQVDFEEMDLDGVWLRGFWDRGDLYRVMIQGTTSTLEDGLFFFDMQFDGDFIAYSSTTGSCGGSKNTNNGSSRVRTIKEAIVTIRNSLNTKLIPPSPIQQLKVVDQLMDLLQHPPELFRNEVVKHVVSAIPRIVFRENAQLEELTEEKGHNGHLLSTGFIQAVQTRLEKLYELFQTTVN